MHEATSVRSYPRVVLAATALLLAALLAAPPGGNALAAHAGESPSVTANDTVPQPTVEGPIPDGTGIRTGQPYATTLIPLEEGWVEEEFFLSGNARSSATGNAGTPYKTRILVRRPTDPAEFNGTVLLDWTNVTIPDDTDVSWVPMHRTIMHRGFVYVAVAAQRLAVEISPIALKQWDPVRYGSLNHPGDNYSFDIFSQASEALLDPRVLGDLRPHLERRLALGASQSAGRLSTYVNNWQAHDGVFDGFQPQISGSGSINRNIVPVLWVNSQAEISGNPAADSGQFRLWEIAGPAHTTNEYNSHTNAVYVYSHTNGAANTYDHETVGGWGYQHIPGTCQTRNFYPVSYAWSAAIVALDDWVRTGIAPDPMPRALRPRQYDEHGNLRGGVRNPVVDVPIATYLAGGSPRPGPCTSVGGNAPLTGFTEMLSAANITELYPTRQAYVDQFEAAVADALEKGFILPEGAEDLIRRVNTYGRPGDA